MREYYVYIMSNRYYGTLYVGVTNNLIRRVWEHKNLWGSEFTATHQINKLVYFESTNDITSAIAKEKALKKWRRKWKINLINQGNPEWRDLYYELL